MTKNLSFLTFLCFTPAFALALGLAVVAGLGSWAVQAAAEVGVVRAAGAVKARAARAEGAVLDAGGKNGVA